MPDPAVIAAPPRGEVATAHAPMLALSGVSKTWRGGGAVLRDVDLELHPGESVAVAGANGAGKTTLLRIAAALILPDAGSVAVAGFDPERDRTEFQRRIGFLSAGNSGLYGRLTAENHLEFVARLALMPKRERQVAIDRVIDAFGLASFCGRRVDRTSMGQRQRLRLALTFIHDPVVALLDEPATSLDEEGLGLVQAALDDLKSRGGCALICVPTGWKEIMSVDRHHLLADGHLTEGER
jgi:ABC-type multidrug transport system ATPase subunit